VFGYYAAYNRIYKSILFPDNERQKKEKAENKNSIELGNGT